MNTLEALTRYSVLQLRISSGIRLFELTEDPVKKTEIGKNIYHAVYDEMEIVEVIMLGLFPEKQDEVKSIVKQARTKLGTMIEQDTIDPNTNWKKVIHEITKDIQVPKPMEVQEE